MKASTCRKADISVVSQAGVPCQPGIPDPTVQHCLCSRLQDKRLEEAAALHQGLEAQLQQQNAQLAASSVRQQQQQVDALQQRLEGEQAARAAAEAEGAALKAALEQGRERVQQAQEQQGEAERLRAEIRRLQVKVSTCGTWCHVGTVAVTNAPCGYVTLAVCSCLCLDRVHWCANLACDRDGRSSAEGGQLAGNMIFDSPGDCCGCGVRAVLLV